MATVATGLSGGRFASRGDVPAVVSPAGECTFAELAELCRSWTAELQACGVSSGTVVGLDGDFSPNAIALFLALAECGAIVVPQSVATRAGRKRKDEIAEVEAYFYVDADDRARFEPTDRIASHRLYGELRRRRHPGIALFSSGTSGEPKVAIHDLVFLLEKFDVPRPALRTLVFLLFDHWGGLNTMLHALSNGGTAVSTGGDRSPAGICQAIERRRIELLPTTPTFLNLLLLSGAQREHDLSSLRVISYGAEPMTESTLVRLRIEFPDVKLQQTYGLIEVGAMRTRSREDGSLWVKVGGEGYETRVVDGILQIRARSMVMGYINAPDPITEDGWLITGDAVLEEGEYLRILGRAGELINVGGEKVYPAEVESVIEAMPQVAGATVFAEANPLAGEIVCAEIRPRDSVDPTDLPGEVKRFCRERLERHKVPIKIRVVEELRVSSRFKKLRR